ncbi:MAG TPA: hypothetical protein VNS49_09710 [Streptomyces sp.]|nr:hypothetical protein [Streptomyces sp.]
MNRHRFEPARLLLGLLLVGGALMYVLDALGEWRVPVWAQLAALPVALVLAAFTAWTTFAVRRRLRRRVAAPPALGGMPMDDLREGYGRGEGGPSGRSGGNG